MTKEEIRKHLGLKTREEFFREHVAPRVGDTYSDQWTTADALSICTGKTTEMLLSAAAYALKPRRKPFVIVASRQAHAIALRAQLRDILESLGRPEPIHDVECGTTLRAGYEHFVDHSWNLVQEPR